MKTAITYHRVSTRDQNPDLAAAELAAAARVRGFEARAIRETGSGRANDRPGLIECLRLIESGAAAAVIVWKLDRFGRSPMDLLSNIERIRRAGGRFVVVTQGIDVGAVSDPTGDLILRVLAAVAGFERDLISERTRLGVADAKRRGVRWGRPPVVHWHEVTKARFLKASGRTWREIVRDLRVTYSPRTLKRAVERAPRADKNGPPRSVTPTD